MRGTPEHHFVLRKFVIGAHACRFTEHFLLQGLCPIVEKREVLHVLLLQRQLLLNEWRWPS